MKNVLLLAAQQRSERFDFFLAVAAVATAILISALWAPPAEAQTYSVLYTFSGREDGAGPRGGGLIMDSAGNLYGTTVAGGQWTYDCSQGCGTIFKMSPSESGWAFSTLYRFQGGADGIRPEQVLGFGPVGGLYGTTQEGGEAYGGTVFKLTPAPTACKALPCLWTKTVLHQFQGAPEDGSYPTGGSPVFDRAGNLYATTYFGGTEDAGIVYELQPSAGWQETVLQDFTGDNGYFPWSGVVFDDAGNLYGTTSGGGSSSDGVIFQLTPSPSGWVERVLHSFDYHTEGFQSDGPVVFDHAGNMYGTTSTGGPGGGGTAWELSPAGDNWSLTVIHVFPGRPLFNDGPYSGLLLDQAGNLYGTTQFGGAHGWGTVFKLSRSGQGWNYSTLYDFNGDADGAEPDTQLVMDSKGQIFGATLYGGKYQSFSGFGVIFKISPQ
jgi:uncharacterized repeat protein (TIGR03803 family)